MPPTTEFCMAGAATQIGVGGVLHFGCLVRLAAVWLPLPPDCRYRRPAVAPVLVPHSPRIAAVLSVSAYFTADAVARQVTVAPRPTPSVCEALPSRTETSTNPRDPIRATPSPLLTSL